MVRKFYLLLLIGISLLCLSTHTYSEPSQKWEGRWFVRGRTSNGMNYTGAVKISKYWRIYWMTARFDLANGEKLFSFWTIPDVHGNTISFEFTTTSLPGVIESLENLARESSGGEGEKSKVIGKYVMAEDGTLVRGGWKAERRNISGRDVWTKDRNKIVVTSVSPNELEGGSNQDVVLTINGANFPEASSLKPKDVSFLLDGKADEKIKVKEILEVDDGGTSLQVRVSMKKDILTGKRDVQVKEGLGKGLLEIKRPAKKLPLGGSLKVVLGDTVRVYIPNAEGGSLEIKGLEGIKLHKGSESGEEVKVNDKGVFEVKSHGWYYLDFTAANLNGEAELKARYFINAKVPDDRVPWNFWYYPFVESYTTGRNLYKEGEVYEKLDKLFGLKPEKDGWKKFDPTKHMDWWAPKHVRDKIFKKIYEANPDQDWDKLNELREKLINLIEKIDSGTLSGEELEKARKELEDGKREYWKTLSEYQKNFKLDGLSEEEKNLYNPTTIQGFGYCYLRSKDSEKGWWGHCWGAVVASSLYKRPPEGKTVKGADGSEIKFTQEDLEAILTDYHTNHSVYPTNYMSKCPPGPPSEEKNQPCDSYPDDFWVGLMTGIRQNGLPLAINIRESYVHSGGGNQVWNQVAWRFNAEISEKDGDETYVHIKVEVGYSEDTYPSDEGSWGRVNYEFDLKYNPDGSLDRDNLKYQNWTSASAYCPSYLWRIERSTTPMGTDNEVLRGRLPKLIEIFGYKRVDGN